jgi:hypothetical protein
MTLATVTNLITAGLSGVSLILAISVCSWAATKNYSAAFCLGGYWDLAKGSKYSAPYDASLICPIVDDTALPKNRINHVQLNGHSYLGGVSVVEGYPQARVLPGGIRI